MNYIRYWRHASVHMDVVYMYVKFWGCSLILTEVF